MQTVRNLESRIEDWKGHHISNFGELLLEDIFVVTKSDVDREYHVFLFQRIILCCKELALQPQNAKKVGKSNSILKKQVPNTLQIATPGGKAKKNTPLLLKGRIFLNNVTQATPRSSGMFSRTADHFTLTISTGQHSLAVWWRGDDDLEFFTLRCRNEEQLRQWEVAINKLINETAARRASERPAPRPATQPSTSTSPILQQGAKFSRPENGRDHRYYNQTSAYRQPQDDPITSPVDRVYGSGAQGYPSHDGFEGDGDDDYEDYPQSILPSGRATPLVGRRSQQSDLHDVQYFASRMSGSNSGGFPTTPSTNGSSSRPLNGPSSRPSTGRTTPSFNSQHDPRLSSSRPPLRSQFSSTRLRPETMESRTNLNATDVPLSQRSRSLSQPTAYLPKSAAPPLPSSSPWIDTPPNGKRGSGSSQSSSDYSGHASPITPYGSSESSLLRGSRSQGFDSLNNANPNVKVKVHFHEDIFVIQVPLATEYSDLVERVGRKIRLCGPRRDDGPLRVKYRDDDGDLVSLGSTEDVQMAFEMLKPGGQVTLYVT
jgi:cell division control protein 24